jgi:hypothetical protein
LDIENYEKKIEKLERENYYLNKGFIIDEKGNITQPKK